MCRRSQHVGANFQDTKAADALKPHLQGFCEGCCAGIANFVAPEVQDLEGVVVLQEIERKTTVSGGLTGFKIHVDIV
jgi:hypothetical protein